MQHQRMIHAGERPIHTPWGVADQCREYADGITFYGTPSHGGFKLDRERNAKVHRDLREPGGWYEEDCAWAKVAFTFPECFSESEREAATRALKQWYPDAWETITGTVLQPGQSLIKDERLFRARHAEDWIVISAISSRHHPGMVECIATEGGLRGEWGKPAPVERRYLIAEDEYQTRCPNNRSQLSSSSIRPAMNRMTGRAASYRGIRGDASLDIYKRSLAHILYASKETLPFQSTWPSHRSRRQS